MIARDEVASDNVREILLCLRDEFSTEILSANLLMILQARRSLNAFNARLSSDEAIQWNLNSSRFKKSQVSTYS